MTTARMRAVRRRDTVPELALRRELHRRGLRYFVDRAPTVDSRTRADILFPRRKVAVYVDGCFWHGCPEHGTAPGRNAAAWAAKIAANVARDRDTDSRLGEAGWRVVRIWSHEAVGDAVERVVAALERAAATRVGGSS